MVRNQNLVRLPAVPCEFVPDKLKVQNENRAALRELFAGWGFKGMLEALDATVEKQAELI